MYCIDLDAYRENPKHPHTSQHKMASSSTRPSLDSSPREDLWAEWLEPLTRWKTFGVFLPGIKQKDINKIEEDKTGVDNRKMALWIEWTRVYPPGTWADVISALKRLKENALAADIEERLRKGKVFEIKSSKKRAQLKQETFDTTTTTPSNESNETEETDNPSASNAGSNESRHRTSHAAAHSSGTKESDKSLPLKPLAERPNPPTYENWSKFKMCAVGLVLLGVILSLFLVGYVAFNWYSTQGLVIYGVLVAVMFILISVGYLVFKKYSTQGLIIYGVLAAIIYVLFSVGYLVFNWYSTLGLIIYAVILLVTVFAVAEAYSIWKPILRIVIFGAFITGFIGTPITLILTWINGGDITKLEPLIALVQSAIFSATIGRKVVALVFKNLEEGNKTKAN